MKFTKLTLCSLAGMLVACSAASDKSNPQKISVYPKSKFQLELEDEVISGVLNNKPYNVTVEKMKSPRDWKPQNFKTIEVDVSAVGGSGDIKLMPGNKTFEITLGCASNRFSFPSLPSNDKTLWLSDTHNFAPNGLSDHYKVIFGTNRERDTFWETVKYQYSGNGRECAQKTWKRGPKIEAEKKRQASLLKTLSPGDRIEVDQYQKGLWVSAIYKGKDPKKWKRLRSDAVNRPNSHPQGLDSYVSQQAQDYVGVEYVNGMYGAKGKITGVWIGYVRRAPKFRSVGSQTMETHKN